MLGQKRILVSTDAPVLLQVTLKKLENENFHLEPKTISKVMFCQSKVICTFKGHHTCR